MITLLFTGPLFVILGLVLFRFPPRKINAFIGYRTLRSTKDQATWDMAQQISSREMIKVGVVQSLCAIPSLWFPLNSDRYVLLALGILIGSAVLMIMRVERKLQAFHKRLPKESQVIE